MKKFEEWLKIREQMTPNNMQQYQGEIDPMAIDASQAPSNVKDMAKKALEMAKRKNKNPMQAVKDMAMTNNYMQQVNAAFQQLAQGKQ